jgi:hypothetical protein
MNLYALDDARGDLPAMPQIHKDSADDDQGW